VTQSLLPESENWSCIAGCRLVTIPSFGPHSRRQERVQTAPEVILKVLANASEVSNIRGNIFCILLF